MAGILRTSMIELGDTGTLNMKPGPKGQVLFTIGEHGVDRASVVLDREKVLYTIRVLCHLTGINVKESKI